MLDDTNQAAEETTVRTVLRKVTQTLHRQTETVWTPSGRFVSEESYHKFLGALLSAHKEVGLAAAIARGDDEEAEEESRRIEALTADLQLDSPVCAPVPGIEMTPDYAWGVSYVLNGSALGASILLKGDALAPHWPRRYLTLGHQYARSGRLKNFFERLNTEAERSPAVERGATDTFSILFKAAPKRARVDA
ncbi:MAG: biliverdin-producing heme oxygenase [Pseudomonadota bacterium]